VHYRHIDYKSIIKALVKVIFLTSSEELAAPLGEGAAATATEGLTASLVAASRLPGAASAESMATRDHQGNQRRHCCC